MTGAGIAIIHSDAESLQKCMQYPRVCIYMLVYMLVVFPDQAHNVTLLGKTSTGSLRSGSQHEFRCVASGSRPAALLTWWFNDRQVRPDVDNVHVVSK